MTNLKTAAIIVVVMVAAGILFGGRINPTDADNTATPTPPPTNHHTPNEPVTTDKHTPSASTDTHNHAPGEGHHDEEQIVPTPTYDGGEHPDWTVPPQERHRTIETAAAFVEGWLTTDPQQRAQLLAPVAAEALVDELSVEGVRIWNATPAGTPKILELLATDAMVRQAFTDGRAIDLLLAAEPDSPTSWIVTHVAPATNQ